MGHPMFQNWHGFPFSQTELGSEVLASRKEAAHDTIAWLDLDGDGHLDLIAIATQQGDDDDMDHELVALHIPSGKAMWRARRGQISTKLALADGVLVATTDNSRVLRGLSPQDGSDIWSLELPDAIEGWDTCDHDDAAPTILVRGGYVAFQCEDESAHVVEAKTGRLVKSFQDARLEHAWPDIPNLVCFVVKDESERMGRDEKFVAWDAAKNQPLLESTGDVSIALGEGEFALLAEDDDNDCTNVHIYDMQTLSEKRIVQAAIKEEGGRQRELPMGDKSDDSRQGAYLLPTGMLVVGERDRVVFVELGGGQPAAQPEPEPEPEPPKKKGFFARLFGGGGGGGDDGGGKRGASGPGPVLATPIPPPAEGYEFCGMVRAGDTLAIAHRKSKGTEKLIVTGYDLGPAPAISDQRTALPQKWVAEGLGGRRVEVSILSTGSAILAPHSPKPEDHHWHEGNKQSWWHLDPATGEKVTEYPVAEIQCATVHGRYFCAFAATYGSCIPVAYDTEQRERVL